MIVEKMVSIIIPCFNGGRYLPKTIESVLGQTYHNFEIIIVDDGSTDITTRQFLSNLSHPNIKVFFQDHEGVSATRNFAISKSKGDYILPLDADDLITNDYLELAVKSLNENPDIKLVTCNVETFGYRKGSIPSVAFSMEKLLARNLFVVSSLFRRSDFLSTSGFNPNMREGLEDWDFWITLLKTGGEVFRIYKTCFFYRIHKKSRNNQLKGTGFSKLRNQIYENHKDLYHTYYIDPAETFEYVNIKNAMEYKVGLLLLKPFRFWQKLIN
jgi:glycosyltransferase involved in cell wall biosynthesis